MCYNYLNSEKNTWNKWLELNFSKMNIGFLNYVYCRTNDAFKSYLYGFYPKKYWKPLYCFYCLFLSRIIFNETVSRSMEKKGIKKQLLATPSIKNCQIMEQLKANCIFIYYWFSIGKSAHTKPQLSIHKHTKYKQKS